MNININFNVGDEVIVINNMSDAKFNILLGKALTIQQQINDRTFLVNSRIIPEIGRDICVDIAEILTIDDFKKLQGRFVTPLRKIVEVSEIVIDEEYRKLAVIYETLDDDKVPRMTMSVKGFLNIMQKIDDEEYEEEYEEEEEVVEVW